MLGVTVSKYALAWNEQSDHSVSLPMNLGELGKGKGKKGKGDKKGKGKGKKGERKEG